MASSTLSTFAAAGDNLPEWLRIMIVAGFVLVAFNAVIVALLWTRPERERPEDIQQGDWDWPTR